MSKRKPLNQLKLIATNDDIIERLINDSRYQFFPNGDILTTISAEGYDTGNMWRKTGVRRNDGYVEIRYEGKKLRVHRVIFRKFLGKLDKLQTINHKDGNPTNNDISNLELVPMGANTLHRFRVLGHPPVKGNKKISQELAKQMRIDRLKGAKYTDLMKKYGLTSKGTISAIINNKTW